MHFHFLAAVLLSIALPATVVTILGVVLVALVPIVSVPINRVILNAAAWIDGLPAVAKQFVVVLVTTGLTTLATTIGHPLPATLGGFDTTVVADLLNVGITFLLHHVITTKEATASHA